MKVGPSTAILLLSVVVGFAVAVIPWLAGPQYDQRTAVAAGREHVLRDATGEMLLEMGGAPQALGKGSASPQRVSSKWMAMAFYRADSHIGDMRARDDLWESAPPEREFNYPRRYRAKSNVQGLFLVATPKMDVGIDGKMGMQVDLVNTTGDLLSFPSSDGTVSIVQQAQDENGIWRAIERLPQSDCGNSHYPVYLPPGHFWRFEAPRYEGTLQTRLRFAISLAGRAVLHSNCFDGSVNPEQFALRPPRFASSRHDPFEGDEGE